MEQSRLIDYSCGWTLANLTVETESSINKLSCLVFTPPPPTELRYPGPWLVVFQPVTTVKVHKLILSAPNKSCDLDLIPTTFVKQCCAELLPAITSIINGSLMSGVFPSDYKVVLVRPIIKKSSLDPDVIKNYRPVSYYKVAMFKGDCSCCK